MIYKEITPLKVKNRDGKICAAQNTENTTFIPLIFVIFFSFLVQLRDFRASIKVIKQNEGIKFKVIRDKEKRYVLCKMWCQTF